MSWSISSESIHFHLEDESSRWDSEFSSEFVEDISKKTGSFKKFGVFMQMLENALIKPGPNLYADVLTVQDLELLKHRNKANTTHASHHSAKGSGKRYLIITYVTDFDRIHYPLPLAVCSEPSQHMLENTIARLRSRCSPNKNSQQLLLDLQQKIDLLEKDNQKYKEQLRKTKALQKKTKTVSNLSNEVQLRLESERSDWLQERSELHHTISNLKQEIRSCETKSHSSKDSRTLTNKITLLESTLRETKASHKRIIDRCNLESNKNTEELNRLRLSNKQLRERLRDTSTTRQVLSSRQSAPRAGRSRELSNSRSNRVSNSRMNTNRVNNARVNTNRVNNARVNPVPRAKRADSPRRFDPTAYQREREAKLRKPRALSGYTSADSNNSRVTTGSRKSYTSNLSNVSKRSNLSNRSNVSKGSNVSKRSNMSRGSKSSNRSISTVKSAVSKTSSIKAKKAVPSKVRSRQKESMIEPKGGSNSTDALDGSMDMTDIDSRLSALQDFLKKAKAN